MQIFNKHMKNKIVFSYEITRACNLRCSYCYALSYLDQEKTHDDNVSNLVVKKIKKFTEDYPDWNFELDILGGDPLSASNIFEFLDNFLPLGLDTWMVTNLVPVDNTKIHKLKEYLIKYPNFGVSATWHDELNHKMNERFKDNILYLKDEIKDVYSKSEETTWKNVVVSFVLFDGNETMVNKAKWCLENDIMYAFTHRYDNQIRYEKYADFSSDAKFVFNNAKNHGNKYFIDDKQLTPEEFEEQELYQISHKYDTICEPLNFHIDFFGNVVSSCKLQPKITYNLFKEDITPKRLYCKGYDCYCSVLGYKELYNEKNKIT